MTYAACLLAGLTRCVQSITFCRKYADTAQTLGTVANIEECWTL